MQLKTVADGMQIKAIRSVKKDWGVTHTLYAAPTFRVNLLYIEPQKEIAPHYHEDRSEIWAIAEGSAEIHRDDTDEFHGVGQSVIIPPGLLHKIRNNSFDTPLKVVEVQMGNSFGQDDIIAPGREKLMNTDPNFPLISQFEAIASDTRPWGDYQVIHKSKYFQIKILGIKPKESISRQIHKYRQETWMIAQGIALIDLNHETKILGPIRSIFIPHKAMHRLKNPSMVDMPLSIVELQSTPTGIAPYFEEDDIQRIEDKYGRK